MLVIDLRHNGGVRSDEPFFESPLTGETIASAAGADGRLLLYCGAGVTIDRTGHSWQSLIMSLLPERRHKNRPGMPTRSDVERLRKDSPEPLASSVVYLLRESSGGGEKLQRTLRERLRESLYRTQGQWQGGNLIHEVITLGFLRAWAGRDMTILTTNYDTYLEQYYRELRDLLSQHHRSFPGLRVLRAGDRTPLRLIEPLNMPPGEPGEYLELVYLHGCMPPVGAGKVSWPLVLDENSYASSANEVEAAIQEAFTEASFALILGTSLRDTPLVRALSKTRETSCERIGVMLRLDFAHDDESSETLALQMAQNRASELAFTPLLPDFPSQIAQLLREIALHMVFPSAEADNPLSLAYGLRLEAWWDAWSTGFGADTELNDGLRMALDNVHTMTGLTPQQSPMDPQAERLQMEVWVRDNPASGSRRLRRWGRASDVHPDGVAGKASEIERNSYLAPIRTFVEGRPLLLDVESLDGKRHRLDQYTWKSFLCVPIRSNSAIVGVMCLASSAHVDDCAMTKDKELTGDLVTRLYSDGAALLDVIGS